MKVGAEWHPGDIKDVITPQVSIDSRYNNSKVPEELAYKRFYNGVRALVYKSLPTERQFATAFAYPEFGLDGDLAFHPDKIQDEHIEMLFLAAGIYQRQVVDIGREHFDIVLRETLPIRMVESELIQIRGFFGKVDPTNAHKCEISLVKEEQSLARKFFTGIQKVITGQKPKVHIIRIVVESGTKIKTVFDDLVFLNKDFEAQLKEFDELKVEQQERRKDTIEQTSLNVFHVAAINHATPSPKPITISAKVLAANKPVQQSPAELKGSKKANGLDMVAHETPLTVVIPSVKLNKNAHQTPITGIAARGVMAPGKDREWSNKGGNFSDDAILVRGVQRLYSIFLNTNNRNVSLDQKFSQASLINNMGNDDATLLNQLYSLASFKRDLTKTDAAVYSLQLPPGTDEKRVEEIKKALRKIMKASTQFGQILDPISLAKDQKQLDGSYKVNTRLEESPKGFWAGRSKPKPVIIEMTVPNGSNAETVFETINALQTIKGIGASSSPAK